MNFRKLALVALSIICGSILFAQTSKDATIQVTITYTVSPAKIKFSWTALTGASNIKIYRKSITADSWGSAIVTLSGSTTQYTDVNVTVGTAYEYKIEKTPSNNIAASTYIYTGIQVPAIENRGKMILIVDNTMATPLLSELKRLERDLIGDGWQIKRIDVSRTASVTSVKTSIINEYNIDPQNVKAVFLFGHIPVPYSGNLNPDGHTDHKGAWPADVYYGDMDGDYTDIDINNSSASRPQNRNIPGDGKFDTNVIPEPNFIAELEVGRVDMSNMPEFSLSETELLRQYLNRNYNFKHKVINPQRRALIDDYLAWGYGAGEAFASNGWRNFAAILGASKISELDYLTTLKTQDYLWSYASGPGSYTSMDGILANGLGTTHHVDSIPPKTVFTMLFGSYFGDWDSNDNFLRAPLAANGLTLASMWVGRPWWYVHHMGLGLNIGYSTLLSQNNYEVYDFNPFNFNNMITISLMGDPSLRMHVVAPPSNFNNSYTNGAASINLTWNASSEAVAGYHVYRLDPITKKYNRVNNDIISGLNYTDTSPNSGINYYMVRAAKLETANVSGCYYNLSQGIFDTVQTTLSINDIEDNPIKLNIYPTPVSSGFASIELALSKEAEVKIILIDIFGKEVKNIAKGRYTEGNHLIGIDCNNLGAGTYNCVVYLNNNKYCNKSLVIIE